MSVSFRSVFMVASCAGAALGCYLVSLHVASERAALEEVETQIVLAQRDIRVLQTEIGTRGRLAQLERWNVKVMALSAPSADQFLKGGFELARLTAPERREAIEAPVILASAPAEVSAPLQSSNDEARSAAPLLRQASLRIAEEELPAPVAKPVAPKVKPAARPAGEPTKTLNKVAQQKSKETTAKSAKAAANAPQKTSESPDAKARKTLSAVKPESKKVVASGSDKPARKIASLTLPKTAQAGKATPKSSSKEPARKP